MQPDASPRADGTPPRPSPVRGESLADFRVHDRLEIAYLLRALRDGRVPVHLSSPDGAALVTQIFALDETLGQVALSADEGSPAVQRLLAADELVGLAYLESVQLQFELRGAVLVHGATGCALQARWPSLLHRIQRRAAYRVRTPEHGSPCVRLRHPSIPEMQLALRVLDVSIGGCALLAPGDVPPLPPGVRIEGVRVELDADTRFQAALDVQHVTDIPSNGAGLRLGCEWAGIDGMAQRTLQRYIDQTQKRRRQMGLT